VPALDATTARRERAAGQRICEPTARWTVQNRVLHNPEICEWFSHEPLVRRRRCRHMTVSYNAFGCRLRILAAGGVGMLRTRAGGFGDNARPSGTTVRSGADVRIRSEFVKPSSAREARESPRC
jgi:hypothetical protein